MNRDDFIDKILGGIFAVVAIVAAVIELVLGDISTATVAACIKDVFSTLAVVVLFFAVIKDRIPKIKFEKRLQSAIESWQQENANMILRKPEHDIEHTGATPSCYSLDLKTSVIDFYEPHSVTSKTGLFLRMPTFERENYISGNIVLKFYLNKGTFFSSSTATDAELKMGYEKLSGLFCDLVNNKHRDFAVAKAMGKELLVTINNPIQSNKDINDLVEVINTVYTAYLVSANIETIV